MQDLARSKRNIIDRLKLEGPSEAGALARALGVTAMAVRQQLADLEAQGLVAAGSAAKARGRPAKLWRLTEAADAFFPNGYADLTAGLLGALKEVFGEAGMARLVAQRTEQQIAA